LVEREIVDSSDDESSQASNGSFEEGFRDEYLVGYMCVPTRKKTNEDGSKAGNVKSESSDNSKVIPPIKRLKLEDGGSVESNNSSNSSSSDDSDSRGPPPLVLHRVDSYSSSFSSESGEEEEEFEIQREEEAQEDMLELQPIYNVRGN
jgi:hypothetical protein